jgi:hypothetical protein
VACGRTPSGIVSSLRPLRSLISADLRRSAVELGHLPDKTALFLPHFCLISASCFRKCLRCKPRIRASPFLVQKSFILARPSRRRVPAPSRCVLHEVVRALLVRWVFQSCLQRSCISCISWLLCCGVLFNTPKNGTPTDTKGHQRTPKAEKISHHLTSSDIISHRYESEPRSVAVPAASASTVPVRVSGSYSYSYSYSLPGRSVFQSVSIRVHPWLILFTCPVFAFGDNIM